ncbi:Fc.00g010370.m01.CDS01 [Cosmosporella sp. VM-42]
MASETSPTPEPALQPELVPAPQEEIDDHDETDSAVGDDASSSLASLTSSILEYRTIKGRTYHSDRHSTQYFTPNDDQQQESVDCTHHYLMILFDGELYQAPIPKNPQNVLDVGTGTGIWAIDFADEFPGANVVGTDLSPIQPTWVPPNLKFEIDDATQAWTWEENKFDFIHMRYLFGGIENWTALFKEAYRCCAPGGWVQSAELDPEFLSDDDTLSEEPALAIWAKLYIEGGKKLGRSFHVVKEELQNKGMEEAGFVNITSTNYKIPIGPWAKDKKLAEIGEITKIAMLNDVEAVIRAAERCRSPAVIQLSPWSMHFQGPSFVKYVSERAHAASVPISVHLDHYLKPSDADLALECALDSIMVDGSMFEEEENINYVRSVFDRARVKNITIEAELGRMEGGEGGIPSLELEGVLANPEHAARFVREIGTHYLAPSFGNVHGPYGPGGAESY